MPIPPPTHRPATPRLPSFCFKAYKSVTRIRAPTHTNNKIKNLNNK